MREVLFGLSSVASPVNVQYAALPWRRAKGAFEFLLITTSNTRRWIVPKGWPVEGISASECAEQEALEEAGIEGEVASEPLGSFRHHKERRSGEAVLCTVYVFPMEVTRQRQSWPEKNIRETRWCSVEDALARIKDPGLRRLILKFVKSTQQLPRTA
jgi:8-oxo-dGTP pyrophosphatase MutT (NUDIX family)